MTGTTSVQEAYKARTALFWTEVREEYTWWCTNFGPTVGTTMFWQLAETKWHWQTLVKGWEPKDEWWEGVWRDAELLNEAGGNTDGVWAEDAETKVVPMHTPMCLLPGEPSSTYDYS